MKIECKAFDYLASVSAYKEYCRWFAIVLQNFDSIPHVKPGQESFYGGSVSLADYCPYIQEFTWRSKNVIVRGSHCQYIENNPST
jgi:hypothetical protein